MTPAKPLLALFEPDIPQNAGTALRTCACLGFDAAIIEPAGFPVSDRAFRRAGMDYLDQVATTRHASFETFDTWRRAAGRRMVLLTTQAITDYWDFAFDPGDIVLVGRESAGVPALVHDSADARVRIPMRPGVRSLNVAIAAAMAMGELCRQAGSRETRRLNAAE